MPLVTPTYSLYERTSNLDDSDSSSSSSSHDKCSAGSGKLCQRPVSYGSLQIGLGIGIPAAVILIVLSLFMLRTLRKNRKESQEHDPDFDENGDATALPDFPAFLNEDPFDNRYSIPPQKGLGMSNPNRSNAEILSMSTKEGIDRAMFDGFVLPYQHQLGSKASLEEFAKQTIDNTAPGSTGRRSTMVPLFISTAGASNRTSPQKSHLCHEQKRVSHTRAPPGKLTKEDYRNLASDSTGLLGDDDFYNTKEDFEDDSHGDSKLSSNVFSVEYEHEKQLPINEFSAPVPQEEARERPVSTGSNDMPEPDIKSQRMSSGYKDEHLQSEIDHNTTNKRASNNPFMRISTADVSHEEREIESQPQMEERPQAPEIMVNLRPENGLSKSPRMSAFNLLKNISDDEGEGEGGAEGEGDVSADIADMNPEQAEELARMKSVYKVYFDRANSVKTMGTEGRGHEFHADATQQLPSIDIDNLRINENLKGDTLYDKRRTATSSIYDENPIFPEPEETHHPYQQLRMPHQQYQQYGYEPQNMGPPAPREIPELPPLKTLPSASEIRRSTIETFTDYHPRHKPPPSGNLNGSNASSPQLSTTGSFASLRSPTGESMPTLREGDDHVSSPSPHQLSRTSVVMMNATNQIKSKERYRPAGSVPNVLRSPAYGGHPNDELAASHDDLIPGNRKSAVRRMMNSNF